MQADETLLAVSEKSSFSYIGKRTSQFTQIVHNGQN